MKVRCLLAALLGLCLVVPSLAAKDLPKVTVTNVGSSTLSKSKTELLTEVLKSELVKSGLFQVLDLQSRQAPDKVAVTLIEAFGDALVVSLKLTDVNSGQIEFSEVVTVPAESQVFASVKQLAQMLASRARIGGLNLTALTPEGELAQIETSWTSVGAQGQVLKDLVALKAPTETYLFLRQYDGTVTPTAYLELLKEKADLEIFRTFLQAGVSFSDSRRAISMGITRLEKFQTQFAPAGFTFREYLESYSLGFVSPLEYKAYRAESGRDFLSVGVGGQSAKVPITDTEFKFFLAQVAWEHSWMKSPSDFYRINTEAGAYLLNFILPAPYFSVELMAGAKPFFAKVGLGAYSEVLLGGHSAVNLRLGLEIDSRFELNFLMALFGTDTTFNYQSGEPYGAVPHTPIQFPYYGLLLTYKLPIATSR